MPSLVAQSCEYCHKLFDARTADIARGWARFCCKSCKAKEQERRTHQYKALKRRQKSGPGPGQP